MARILVVDDEPLVRRTIMRVLSDHELIAVSNGAEALAALTDASAVDLVLCDILLPDMTGKELFDQVAPELRERFVFVTGGTLTREIEMFLRSIDNTVVRKPFTVTKLRDVVARHV